MATSLSTVYLAFDINHAQDWGTGFIFDAPTAELLLHIIEPIQIGYGAVVGSTNPLSRAIEGQLTRIDHILPRRHPLGPGMGEIRRLPWLQTLRYWSRSPCRRVAHSLLPRGIRLNLTILGLHFSILRRCAGSREGLGTTMVLDLSFCVDLHSGSKYCGKSDRQR